jgi:phosphoglucosamine mutase
MPGKYFGTDGIRDAAGKGLLEAGNVQAYGNALGSWLTLRKGPESARVLVGRDPRESGTAIREQLAHGILAHGHALVDGGVLTTPAVQTLCREEGFDLAIVISASHNPASDNGIKFLGPDGRKLPDAAEQALEDLIETPADVAAGSAGARQEDQGAGDRYLSFLRASCFPELDLSGMKIVLDCAHGAGSDLAPHALEAFGADLTVKGAAPDGTNINEGAGVFYVEDLAGPVLERGAVLGMALDGDGDRVLLVDESGEVRDGDHMLGLFAADLKERGLLPGNRLVTTVMANMGLFAWLKSIDVEPEIVAVGDRFVAARMDELQSSIGGEQSGHIIFQDGKRWFGDGLYTALRILEIIRRTGRSLSDLCAGVEKYPQILINVPVRSKPPVGEVPELVAAQERIEKELADLGRVVLRYSGTEPLLRVMIEGKDKELVDRTAHDLADVARGVLGD